MDEVNDEENVLEVVLSEVNRFSTEVKTLNEHVYTKNYLDKIRNALIFGSIITFIVVAFFLGLLLHHQNSGDEDRAREATLGRRQIADCTVKPGVVLDDGYVNPGICYLESAKRTAEAIKTLTIDIQEGVRKLLLIQAEAVAANQTLSEDVRSFARQQVITLRSFTPEGENEKASNS